MEYSYPHLTAGYLGEKAENSTLNSAFYSEFFNSEENTKRSIIFPQRVPKEDFFEEICFLEHKAVKNSLKKFKALLYKKTLASLKNIGGDGDAAKEFLNCISLLLRYGLFKEIIDMNPKINLNKNDFLEFMLLREIAKTELSLCEGLAVSTDSLLRLVNEALVSDDLAERIQILVLNYAIVASYRFGIKLPYEQCLKKCYEKLLYLIKNKLNNDFGSLMRASVAYRGLAMVKEIDLNIKDELLRQAELLARNLKPANRLEKYVADENLYTCLQTLSKWNLFQKRPDATEKNLLEMIKLDAVDSTGYGEMGFFLLNLNRFEEAKEYFKKAGELGPPAVGMHTYYYAKCLQALGEQDNAVRIFQEASKIDQLAISPLLELIDHNLKINDFKSAKKIINNIFENQDLKDQLDDEELIGLKDTLTTLT